MKLYDKINSIWKRHADGPLKGRFKPWEWSTPEIEYLADLDWVWTEKVDGTNIRIGLESTAGIIPKDPGSEPFLRYRIGGRTDNAQIPARLLEAIDKLDLERKLREHFDGPVCLYGEGYGAGIQGGGNYGAEQRFVLFDVTVDGWVLRRADVEDVGRKLGLDVAPFAYKGDIQSAINAVSRPDGVRSYWGDFRAEGLVGTPVGLLYDRQGKRITVKVKSVDFDKLRAAGVTW